MTDLMNTEELPPPFGEPVSIVPPVDDSWRKQYEQTERVLADLYAGRVRDESARRGRHHIARKAHR